MSIEIDVVNGDASWKLAQPLLEAVWPSDVVEKLPWGDVKWAHPDLRVLIESSAGDLISHIGIFFRTVTWNGRKVHIGGLGGVATHPDHRRRGYASVALDAAAQTLRDHDTAQFAVLFCEPKNFSFYEARGWNRFAGEIYSEQPSGRIRFEAMAPFVFDLKRSAPLRGTIDLCGLPW